MLSYIVALIIGSLCGYLLYKIYLYKVEIHGPNSNEIRNKLYYLNGHTYKFTPIVCACDNYHTNIIPTRNS